MPSFRLNRKEEDAVWDEVKHIYQKLDSKKRWGLERRDEKEIINEVFKLMCDDLERGRESRLDDKDRESIERKITKRAENILEMQRGPPRQSDNYGGNNGHSNGGGGSYSNGNGHPNGGGGGHTNGHSNGGGGSYSNRAYPAQQHAQSSVPMQVGPAQADTRQGSLQKYRVLTNCVKLMVDKNLVAHHFDVAFNPEIKLSERRRELVRAAVGGVLPYDGSKILYVPNRKLSATLDVQSGAEVADADESGDRLVVTVDKVSITFSYTSTKEFKEFPRVLDTNDDPSRSHLAVIDIALKQQPSILFKGLGDAFFDERRQAAWSQVKDVGMQRNYELWTGYRQTAFMTSLGAMMQLDTAYKVVHKPEPLLEFFARKLKVHGGGHGLKLEQLKHANREVTKFTWKIISKHNRSMRPYKLNGIDDVPMSQSMFFDDEKNCERSVLEYMREKYPNVPIERPDLPCVCVGPKANPKKIRLPLEWMKLASFQPATITPELQADMIKETCVEPQPRFNLLEKVHQSMLKIDTKTLAGCGVKIDDKFVTAQARQLPAARIIYKDSRGNEAEVRPDMRKGQWNLRNPNGGDLAFVDGARIGSYAVVIFERSARVEVVQSFARMLEKMARDRGMQIGGCAKYIDGTGCREHDADRFLEDTMRNFPEGRRPELLVCVIGDKTAMNAKALYPAIKRWSHSDAWQLGVPTQCVQAGKVANPKLGQNAQYHAGLLLKINLKLNGINLMSPASKGGLQLLREKPTIVFGVDVNHAAPGSSKPSFSALVASMDAECARYYSVVGAQEPRKELVDLEGKVRKCLRQYKEKNGTAPQRIIFFRDGVANNQFNNECNSEISDIRRAAFNEGGADYVPELIYIVVQQRTRARLASIDQGNRVKPRQDGNVPVGTVIDTDIVSLPPNGQQPNNWYLVAHYGLKGTCRPTHYHVLANDTQASLEAMERLVFDLCFLYARATKVVSRPAPVYYAHRAAFLAQYYEPNYREINDQWETGSTASTGSGGSGSHLSIPEIRLNNKAASTVFWA